MHTKLVICPLVPCGLQRLCPATHYIFVTHMINQTRVKHTNCVPASFAGGTQTSTRKCSSQARRNFYMAFQAERSRSGTSNQGTQGRGYICLYIYMYNETKKTTMNISSWRIAIHDRKRTNKNAKVPKHTPATDEGQYASHQCLLVDGLVGMREAWTINSEP